ECTAQSAMWRTPAEAFSPRRSAAFAEESAPAASAGCQARAAAQAASTSTRPAAERRIERVVVPVRCMHASWDQETDCSQRSLRARAQHGALASQLRTQREAR